MENEESVSLETVVALFEHSKAVASRLMALEVITDAFIATVGKSLPPLLPVLQENLLLAADAREDGMEEDQRNTFRRCIADMDRKIEIWK